MQRRCKKEGHGFASFAPCRGCLELHQGGRELFYSSLGGYKCQLSGPRRFAGCSLEDEDLQALSFQIFKILFLPVRMQLHLLQLAG